LQAILELRRLVGVISVAIALEEIMPRAIKSQEAATSIVMIVLTAAICLILIVTAMDLPIRLIH
jgi:hypothetical protein